MSNPWLTRALKTALALATAAALSGCIFVPVGGPRYGYYHPHYYGY